MALSRATAAVGPVAALSDLVTKGYDAGKPPEPGGLECLAGIPLVPLRGTPSPDRPQVLESLDVTLA